MAKAKTVHSSFVVGGVDTHKDLHVAAVVDQNNRILGSEFFSTTRQGYRQMLTWMASFGTVERIGVECTGSYGAGLLRYLQNAKIEVLEVTTPDKMERRKRGKAIRSMQKVPLTLFSHAYAPSHRKRVAEGHSKMEALRCLKRYISREVYTLLRNQNRQINSTQIMT